MSILTKPLKALIVAAVAGASVVASAAPFTLNNVFVSSGIGTVLEYTPTGTLVQTLSVGTGFITGSAFDGSNNFYATRFSNNLVQKFSSAGADLGNFGGGYSTPESVVIDASNNVYVGSIGGGIRKFDSAGAFQSSSIAGTRVDFMDLAADQKTMYFTQEGGEVKRVDVSTDTPLTDFSTDVEQAFALRIRSNGDVIVADGAEIEYLNGLGAETASYDIAGAGLWFALNLDPDGTSFWSATTDGLIARFDIATGTVLSSWTVSDTNGVWGLAILGEPTTGGPGPGPGVPEPGTLALVGLALLGLTKARRAAARRESR